MNTFGFGKRKSIDSGDIDLEHKKIKCNVAEYKNIVSQFYGDEQDESEKTEVNNDEEIEEGEDVKEYEEGESEESDSGEDVDQVVYELDQEEINDIQNDSPKTSESEIDIDQGEGTIIDTEGDFYNELSKNINSGMMKSILRDIVMRQPVFQNRPGPSHKNPCIANIVAQWLYRSAKRPAATKSTNWKKYKRIREVVTPTTFSRGQFEDLPDVLKSMVTPIHK